MNLLEPKPPDPNSLCNLLISPPDLPNCLSILPYNASILSLSSRHGLRVWENPMSWKPSCDDWLWLLKNLSDSVQSRVPCANCIFFACEKFVAFFTKSESLDGDIANLVKCWGKVIQLWWPPVSFRCTKRTNFRTGLSNYELFGYVRMRVKFDPGGIMKGLRHIVSWQGSFLSTSLSSSSSLLPPPFDCHVLQYPSSLSCGQPKGLWFFLDLLPHVMSFQLLYLSLNFVTLPEYVWMDTVEIVGSMGSKLIIAFFGFELILVIEFYLYCASLFFGTSFESNLLSLCTGYCSVSFIEFNICEAILYIGLIIWDAQPKLQDKGSNLLSCDLASQYQFFPIL